MTHISVTRKAKTFKIPVATVEDMLALMDERLEVARTKLLADLKAAEATTEEKTAALLLLRQDYSLTSKLMHSAFSLEGAVAIIRYKSDAKDLDQILDAPADELVYLALKLLGYEENPEEANDSEDDAEGKADQPEKTSTEA